MIQWPKNNDALGTTNRGNVCESGLCTLCESDCKGKCETWLSCMAGRKLLYPKDFGKTTAGSGNTTHVGVNYSALRINGFAYGSKGMAQGLSRTEDDCVFPNVGIETSFGKEIKTKARVPIMTGALGSTFIAAKYWESFAVGAALVGYPIVVGENVVGVDRESEIENGKIAKSPELDRRIDSFLRYYDGYGAIIVQLNVEDTRNGVAEYVIGKYGDKVIIELKWGQGAKNIGGEIQVTSLDYAQFLRNRGYVVDPDPNLAEVQEAFDKGAIRSFARHSRLGYPGLSSAEEVEKNFKESVAYLRKLGYKRISLKTGSYGMEALAMAIKFSTDTGLDLLTIDGSGGGTGMSPWNMMESWGVPSIHLHAKAYQYAKVLEAAGKDVVDLSFAGGLAREDHILKALALGAPFVKLICMGRSLMIPAYLGSNIEGVLYPERRDKLNGNWEKLPQTVKKFGSTEEEIFAAYHEVRKKVGNEEIKNVPLGAIASWTLADKLAAGLQQFMAGARKFSLSEISRSDIFSANRETERETGVPFMTDLEDEQAMKILKG
uniref:Glutamate synthase domain-containing protein 2 n=1 Tax=Candidatus Kentrum sp. FM TaxID=2126340 RepID=A0A450ST78_9GAMM|nr:MAG: Glutamate synthase domain-containing protein 2 [Candidatus Kentron sp. FM]VFJ57161.1 MAG: Glutamate synthase domain-containing protein 2 [Candidatus Kentron sp. FM]VFK17998.1 MAG: Glutamate synthase domain-containing protein 2 [Candidatus Kentron sp. FM]